ncbi:MAG: hypothetical protein J6I84_03320 [Bacilli bacterium]|nr:hypothetical protein [Bacilli bacterium]
MRDDRNRITVAQWKTVKKYIDYSDVASMTPTFGFVVDELRKNYGIYIAVSPVTNSDLSSGTDTKIVFAYRSIVSWVSGNDILAQWSSSEQAYYLAIRRAIDTAINWLEGRN